MFLDTGGRVRIRRGHGHSALLSGVACVLSLMAGCGTLENGRNGDTKHGAARRETHTLWPIDLERVARAGHDALFDARTWVPLAGAALFTIDDFDERASNWAVKHNPIFGSEDGAEEASDYLRDVLRVEAVLTALAIPSDDTLEEWLPAKAQGLAVELGAISATSGLTGWLKDTTDRQRPDGSNEDSFPSGHASTSSSYATLASRNLDAIQSLEDFRPMLGAVNMALTLSVGWARVEAQRHFPSDVLAGAALGHFVTAFIHDAFLNLPDDGPVEVAVIAFDEGIGMALSWRF